MNTRDKTGNNLDCLQQGFQHGLLECPHIKLKRYEPGGLIKKWLVSVKLSG